MQQFLHHPLATFNILKLMRDKIQGKLAGEMLKLYGAEATDKRKSLLIKVPTVNPIHTMAEKVVIWKEISQETIKTSDWHGECGWVSFLANMPEIQQDPRQEKWSSS